MCRAVSVNAAMTVADTIVAAAFSYLGQNGRRKDRRIGGSREKGRPDGMGATTGAMTVTLTSATAKVIDYSARKFPPLLRKLTANAAPKGGVTSQTGCYRDDLPLIAASISLVSMP